jgi:hypothetical protein
MGLSSVERLAISLETLEEVLALLSAVQSAISLKILEKQLGSSKPAILKMEE